MQYQMKTIMCISAHTFHIMVSRYKLKFKLNLNYIKMTYNLPSNKICPFTKQLCSITYNTSLEQAYW